MVKRSARQLAHALLTLVLTAAVLHPVPVNGWGVEYTHYRLADRAIWQVDGAGGFSTFLQKELGLPKGVYQPLAVQLGFDSSIDAEIGPIDNSRLNRSRNLYPDKYGPAPPDARIEINQSCTGSSNPA